MRPALFQTAVIVPALNATLVDAQLSGWGNKFGLNFHHLCSVTLFVITAFKLYVTQGRLDTSRPRFENDARSHQNASRDRSGSPPVAAAEHPFLG
jgi:hypothetical protein